MCEVGGKVCLKLKGKVGEIHWINVSFLRKGNLNNHMSFDNPSRDVLGLMDFTYSIILIYLYIYILLLYKIYYIFIYVIYYYIKYIIYLYNYTYLLRLMDSNSDRLYLLGL